MPSLRHAPRALYCLLASSLTLAACTDSGMGAGGEKDSPTGKPRAVLKTMIEATCEQPNLWQLAPAFQLTRKVDYIADRIDSTDKGLMSDYGMPCRVRDDPETCEAELAAPTALGRHLATTEGDEVRLWTFPAVLNLLGEIDTPEEAIWICCSTATTSRVPDTTATPTARTASEPLVRTVHDAIVLQGARVPRRSEFRTGAHTTTTTMQNFCAMKRLKFSELRHEMSRGCDLAALGQCGPPCAHSLPAAGARRRAGACA